MALSKASAVHESGRQTAPSALREPIPAFLAFAAAAVFVLVVYVWFISVGYWTWWPKTTYTYDLLGSAFRAGQLSLQDAPDPSLLALSDPYEPAARVTIQYPWDSSLFVGKYYLYWGPTPGLLLTILKLFYSGQIADQYLVFCFVLGLFIFACLLALAVWRKFFAGDVPTAVLFISFVALGLVGPGTWLLNRPAGYEAAIAAGQLFFIAGLYFAVTATLAADPSPGRLSLAGISWALALGARISILLPIVAMLIVIVARLLSQETDGRRRCRRLASLMLPLVAGGLILGWYNWARFGSPIEFGLRYQLTFINMRALYDQTFSVRYVPDNLFNYLFNPVARGRVFPFLLPLAPQRLPPGPVLLVPPAQIEPVTGILTSSPFLVYALLPLAALLGRKRQGTPTREEGLAVPAARSPLWLYRGLAISAAAAFIFILLYFFPTMRQEMDVVPLLALLAVFGLWEGWRHLGAHRLWLGFYGLASLTFILGSIVIGCLLAVTSYDNRFQHLNRDLLRELIRFFGR